MQSDTVNVALKSHRQGRSRCFGSVEITLQRMIRESLGSDVLLYNNLKWHSDIDVVNAIQSFVVHYKVFYNEVFFKPNAT